MLVRDPFLHPVASYMTADPARSGDKSSRAPSDTSTSDTQASAPAPATAAAPSSPPAQPLPPAPQAKGSEPMTGPSSGFYPAAKRERTHVETNPVGKRLGFLSLTALGVVYGDIGTSPLYALRECFKASEYGLQPTQENVYGVLSLIVWSLIMVVSVKY